jgi:hypothetical protein
MKISFFTFLRNGVKLGYPFIESIRSALPLADEFIIALGPSDQDENDATRAAIEGLRESKIKLLPVLWNENMVTAGFVYGQQKMLAQSQCNGDWAFYLEADEVLHEKDLESIRYSMQRYHYDKNVEALVFDYVHFFGSPLYQAISPGWYRRAPRVIRNSIRAVACDGLFWNVVIDNQRMRWPRAALANAKIYHYGHVRPLDSMNRKQEAVERYWSKLPRPLSRYQIDPKALAPFTGEHPEVMRSWLNSKADYDFSPDLTYSPTARDKRHRLGMQIEKAFGIDLSRKHFRLVSGE